MVLGAGVEIVLGAVEGRRDALVAQSEPPPGVVHVADVDVAAEDLPAPLVEQIAEGQEGDLVQRQRVQVVEVEFVVVDHPIQQADLVQVARRRHRQRHHVAHRFVEAYRRALSIKFIIWNVFHRYASHETPFDNFEMYETWTPVAIISS